MDKPEVSTNPNIKLSAKEKEEKIIKYLKESNEGYSPKTIARLTGININTVKSVLQRLEQRGIVKLREGLRGFYVLVEKEGHDSVFKWNFQNCILSYELPNYSGELIDKTFNLELVNYTFTIGKESKKATLRISTDYPLNISALCSCALLFSSLTERYSSYNPEQKDILVSSIEFNKDFTNLRLDGVNSITLTNLIEQFKIYQKESCIRFEHKMTVPLKLEDVFSILSQYNQPIKDDHKEIARLMINLSKLMKHILNKISPLDEKKQTKECIPEKDLL